MPKPLYIAEKPSVAKEFAKVLGIRGSGRNYIEDGSGAVSWCVGHLITMSYPEVYDEKYAKWRMEDLPFLPDAWKYEVISSVRDQFETLRRLLQREDLNPIYICTDSGREGEYIYRLVDAMVKPTGKQRLRVWIDSQTEEEILRGIREAKDWSEYDGLSSAAYMRAKEDYLMGINFSRGMTLQYGRTVARHIGEKRAVLSVGRVMSCVLGLVVKREWEIRSFRPLPFYRIVASFDREAGSFEAEWRLREGSRYEGTDKVYKDIGLLKEEEAKNFAEDLKTPPPLHFEVADLKKKTEKKNPPLLFNLAEIQNEASRLFKLSPDETLAVLQDLYEHKLVTYPRTDARVLSSAVAKEITKNLKGLVSHPVFGEYADRILAEARWKGIEKSRYTKDADITDHYAIIPTGRLESKMKSPMHEKIYERVVLRFLAIFFDPEKSLTRELLLKRKGESFLATEKKVIEEGWTFLYPKKKEDASPQAFGEVKKGEVLEAKEIALREGSTSPPKPYTSGSMILAMENAGQLIDDESLREQIKGSGIGTSATRAEILKKLERIRYLKLQKKTQVLSPTLLGELNAISLMFAMPEMLDPKLTASWEKGLSLLQRNEIQEAEYKEKLESFIHRKMNHLKKTVSGRQLEAAFEKVKPYHTAEKKTQRRTKKEGKK